MGCGCKKKAEQQQQQNVKTQQQSANEAVQNAIKKTVNKYYKK
jgi:hypothetical protein